jgi:hypothetical protein
MKKYDCPIYVKIVEMQRLTKRYADADGIVIRFQTEACAMRVVEGENAK